MKWKSDHGINWWYQWVHNPIRDLCECITAKWQWRNRCTYCGGTGTEDIGDYGQSYPIKCPCCQGTGKRQPYQTNPVKIIR